MCRVKTSSPGRENDPVSCRGEVVKKGIADQNRRREIIVGITKGYSVKKRCQLESAEGQVSAQQEWG